MSLLRPLDSFCDGDRLVGLTIELRSRVFISSIYSSVAALPSKFESSIIRTTDTHLVAKMSRNGAAAAEI